MNLRRRRRRRAARGHGRDGRRRGLVVRRHAVLRSVLGRHLRRFVGLGDLGREGGLELINRRRRRRLGRGPAVPWCCFLGCWAPGPPAPRMLGGGPAGAGAGGGGARLSCSATRSDSDRRVGAAAAAAARASAGSGAGRGRGAGGAGAGAWGAPRAPPPGARARAPPGAPRRAPSRCATP